MTNYGHIFPTKKPKQSNLFQTTSKKSLFKMVQAMEMRNAQWRCEKDGDIDVEEPVMLENNQRQLFVVDIFCIVTIFSLLLF